MTKSPVENVKTLTFDIFGTVLDLAGSLIPPLDNLLKECGNTENLKGSDVWAQWRLRQRIEQYQDNLYMLGHSGYLAVKRRALIYSLKNLKVEFTYKQIDQFMEAYQYLSPFPDAIEGLNRLNKKYDLVMLSNGEQSYLEHLAKNQIKFDFHSILSAETVGQFKPHPAVYRFAAKKLNLEPRQIMMVAAHSFDTLGARISGYRGAYVNRYDLPYDESEFYELYMPDYTTKNFPELCDLLGV
ncbi:MAG: haloacid dehalogenase type II [SAR202 cluster bacterium]|nr:haloacid dehalogenase type II [SAR202 cluster bacterium]|tara:strand:- start:316 stop:1038 length:723 start_codon:yes stop_codon:yes gene_type:complete